MKKLRFFDSLKLMLATVACMFILNVAHADNPNCASYIDYTSATGTVTQNGTPTPTNPITPQFYTQNEMVLRAVGDVADSYDAETGKITRRVGVVILDGTENWSLTTPLTTEQYNVFSSNLGRKMDAKAVNTSPLCTHFIGRINQTSINTAGQTAFNSSEAYSTNVYVSVSKSDFPNASDFKAWVAAQYAAKKPLVVYYQLKTPVEEDWPSRQCETIKIATTRYNEKSFAPVKTDLSAAVNAVEYVVSNTMTQAQAIDQIANEKQTRPDEGCPAKYCLLVEDEDGTPHWYEIYDPINDFLNPILAAAALSGNQGAPTQTSHSDGSNTIIDTSNIFYNGSGAFRKKYIDNKQSVADRPFGPATGPDKLPRCADDATRTTSPSEAGICYNTGGMFRTLTEGADGDAGEWAVVYNGNEGGASLGITPGVVYGVAKCTTVGKHTTEITGDEQSGSEYWWPEKLNGYATSNPTTLASLISEYPNSNVETVFNTLPSEYGTDEKPGYPRDNFQNCWCKMTAIGVPGSGENDDQRYANGTIMSVSGGWVFDRAYTSATNCANGCAYNCAFYVRASAAFRRNVLTVR